MQLFEPRYPNILVQRLPREFKYGSLFVPGDDNKVLHEGVVLRVWQPFTREVGSLQVEDFEHVERIAKQETCGEYALHNRCADCADVCMTCRSILAARQMVQASRKRYCTVQSDLVEGDHVVFPHYAGVEHPGLPDKDILLISEIPNQVHQGFVWGKIPTDPATVESELHRVLGAGYLLREHLIPHLLDKFVLVPKRSLTRSGLDTTDVK